MPEWPTLYPTYGPKRFVRKKEWKGQRPVSREDVDWWRGIEANGSEKERAKAREWLGAWERACDANS